MSNMRTGDTLPAHSLRQQARHTPEFRRERKVHAVGQGLRRRRGTKVHKIDKTIEGDSLSK